MHGSARPRVLPATPTPVIGSFQPYFRHPSAVWQLRHPSGCPFTHSAASRQPSGIAAGSSADRFSQNGSNAAPRTPAFSEGLGLGTAPSNAAPGLVQTQTTIPPSPGFVQPTAPDATATAAVSSQALLQEQVHALQRMVASQQQLLQQLQRQMLTSAYMTEQTAATGEPATVPSEGAPCSAAVPAILSTDSLSSQLPDLSSSHDEDNVANPFAAQALAYKPPKARSWTANFATTRSLDAAAERSSIAVESSNCTGAGAVPRSSSTPSPLLMPSVSPFEAQRVAIGDRRFLGLYDARFHSTSLGATPKDYRVLPSRIILVRHAESEGNVDNAAYTTIPDPQVPLTEHGHAQAKAAGKRIKDVMAAGGVDYKMFFYTSPYKRSLQTYEGISSNFPADCIRGVQEEVQLREQDFGNFQDLKGKAQEKEDRQRFGRFFYRFPNGESGADVYDRLTLFEDHMVRDINAGRFAANTGLVLITHGLALRVFLMRWFHWSVDDFLCVFNPPNAEPLVMERVVPKGTALNDSNVWMHTKALYKLTPQSMAALKGCTNEMCTSGVQARLIRRMTQPGAAATAQQYMQGGSEAAVQGFPQAGGRPKDDLAGTRVDAETALKAGS